MTEYEERDYRGPQYAGKREGLMRERKIVKPQHPPHCYWACGAGRKGGPRRTPCKISHKDRRPYTIMALGLAACPVARIPRDLVGDRYDEALAVAACLVLCV